MTNTYDRLIANPPPECYDIGIQDGEICGRYPEPDEDEPRGYKRKPCDGEIITVYDEDDIETPWTGCDTCGVVV